MGFFKQEYWSGLPFSSPGDLPIPGIKPKSSASASSFFTTEPSGKPLSGHRSMWLWEEWIIAIERVSPANLLLILIEFNVYTRLLYCLSHQGSPYTRLLLLNSFTSKKVRHKLNYSICYSILNKLFHFFNYSECSVILNWMFNLSYKKLHKTRLWFLKASDFEIKSSENKLEVYYESYAFSEEKYLVK